MNKNLELGNRMKNYYEQVSKTKLMRKCPVAIRIDGRAFRTFTRGFQKPFDEVIIKSMQETMKYLCENIQGCILGYTQSDEITLILTDYKNIDSDAWFDYEVEKLCSVSASMATMAFNKAFEKNVKMFEHEMVSYYIADYHDQIIQSAIYRKALDKGAMFDARCFNIPKEEITNLLYWRQKDAIRNSIQMVGQANFSHKELHKKSRNDIQDMLMIQKGINWNDLPTYQKRGSCCVKKEIENKSTGYNGEVRAIEYRTEWIIDTEIPLFKDENRNYIEKLL